VDRLPKAALRAIRDECTGHSIGGQLLYGNINMTWANQIISAIEAGGKVSWSVLLSCSVVLALQYFFPESFVGLPEFVFPTIRIVTVFALILSISSLLPPLINRSRSLWQFVYAPLKRRSTQRKILSLHIGEVIILSKAIAQSDRVIWLKPDLPQTIDLLDSGLIRRFWCGVFPGDGTTSFEIPKDVWRVIHAMEEFRIFDPARLMYILTNSDSQTEDSIVSALPQAHPAVRSWVQSETLSQ